MLKKLFKYEWKAFWKVPAAINLFLVILTILGMISFHSPLWRMDSDTMNPLAVLAVVFYYLSIFAGSIAVNVYIAIRFYKNVYTDEGYLTHTLPVAPRSIILSKLFVGAIWSLITAVTIAVSVFALFLTLFNIADASFYTELKTVWPLIKTFINTELEMSVSGLVIFSMIYMLLTNFFSIIIMYASVALGQLFKKHRVMGAIIWYISLYTMIQIVTSLFINIPLAANMPSFNSVGYHIGSFFKPLFAISCMITLVLGVVLFFITEYMMQKKLNLE